MRFLKKLAGSNAGQNTHNNEDARVIASKVPQNKDVEKGKSLKDKAVKLAKVIRRFPYYVWIWEKANEAWDWILEIIL